MVIFTILLYVLSTFVFNREPLSFATVFGGLMFLAAIALVVYMTVDFFAVTLNYAAPLVFACFVLSFPSVAVYDPSMWCALPVSAAFYLAARFYGGDINNDWAFLYSALLGTASLMFPPLAWLSLFLLIMNFFPAGDKIRFAATSIAGFLLPLIIILSYKFATVDIRELSPLAGQYLKAIVSPYVGLGANSAARVIKIIIILVCFAVSLAAFFRRNAEYSVSHSRVMIFILVYSPIITLLLALFSYGGAPMNTLLIMMPVSLVIYDYLIWSSSDRECRIAISFLMLALVLEYAFLAFK